MLRIRVSDYARRLKPYLERSSSSFAGIDKIAPCLTAGFITESHNLLTRPSLCSTTNSPCLVIFTTRRYKSNSQWGGPYSNFGHRTEKMSFFKIFYHMFIMGGLIFTFLDWKRYYSLIPCLKGEPVRSLIFLSILDFLSGLIKNLDCRKWMLHLLLKIITRLVSKLQKKNNEERKGRKLGFVTGR